MTSSPPPRRWHRGSRRQGGSMSHAVRILIVAGAIVLVTAATATFRQASPSAHAQQPVATSGSAASGGSFDSSIAQNAQRLIEEGRRIFRFDTFGDEAFWGDQLRLHQAIVGQKLGGVGSGLSPKMALSLGLKVDADAVPSDVAAQLKAGRVDLDVSASTVVRLTAI